MKNLSFLSRHEVFSLEKNRFHSDILPIIDSLFPYISNSVQLFYDSNDHLIENDDSTFAENSEVFINEIAQNEDIAIFLNIIKRLLSKCSFLTLGVEYYYIDRDYRDSYYMHYSEKHKEISRYCTRVVIFADDYVGVLNKVRFNNNQYSALKENFVGAIVFTPLANRCIGRTLLNPKYFFEKGAAFIRTTLYSVNFKGYQFNVYAFPFRMQDTITTTCAEITIMNILDYYSKGYSNYSYVMPSDIHQIAKQEKYDRHIPSGGLSYELISRILYRAGLAPKFYMSQKIDDKDIRHLISYYIESGIPVAIGTSSISNDKNKMGHSIVCIGHGKCNYSLSLISAKRTPNLQCQYINSADLYNEWIVQDDMSVPYCVFKQIGSDRIERQKGGAEYSKSVDFFETKKIDCIVAPLYKRMYMDAIRAEDTVLSILDDEMYSPQEYLNNSPVIFRLFLASSRHLKTFRISSIRNNTICRLYQEIPLSQFVWVCELYTKNGYANQKAFGEIILDATYSGPNLLESCLMINYPNKHLAQFFDEASLFLIDDPNEQSMVSKESLDFVEFKGPNEFSAYSNLQDKQGFRTN